MNGWVTQTRHQTLFLATGLYRYCNLLQYQGFVCLSGFIFWNAFLTHWKTYWQIAGSCSFLPIVCLFCCCHIADCDSKCPCPCVVSACSKTLQWIFYSINTYTMLANHCLYCHEVIYFFCGVTLRLLSKYALYNSLNSNMNKFTFSTWECYIEIGATGHQKTWWTIIFLPQISSLLYKNSASQASLMPYASACDAWVK